MLTTSVVTRVTSIEFVTLMCNSASDEINEMSKMPLQKHLNSSDDIAPDR